MFASIKYNVPIVHVCVLLKQIVFRTTVIVNTVDTNKNTFVHNRRDVSITSNHFFPSDSINLYWRNFTIVLPDNAEYVTIVYRVINKRFRRYAGTFKKYKTIKYRVNFRYVGEHMRVEKLLFPFIKLPVSVKMVTYTLPFIFISNNLIVYYVFTFIKINYEITSTRRYAKRKAV